MKEEKLREKLKEIEDLSVRKEVREIYQSVFAQIAIYQEERMNLLEQQVRKELVGTEIDYGVDMFLATHEECKKWQDVCSIIDETKNYPWLWNQEKLKRVYLEVTNKQIEELGSKRRLFQALVRTNYDTYKCMVTLQKSDTGVRYVETINEMLESNVIDIPRISTGYAKRFFDVVYAVQNDRLREEERIESIEIDWEELTPYIKEDMTLLCNVRKEQLKERIFPVPEQNELRYKHEIIPRKKEFGYIVDVSGVRDYEIQRTEDLLILKTVQKQYKCWEVYEIVPRTCWERDGKAQNVLSNRVKQSVLTKLQRKRKNTGAEIYRTVISYDVASYFDEIEVLSDEVIFYTAKETYINREYVEMILDDLKDLYPQLSLTGRIIERQ